MTEERWSLISPLPSVQWAGMGLESKGGGKRHLENDETKQKHTKVAKTSKFK